MFSYSVISVIYGCINNFMKRKYKSYRWISMGMIAISWICLSLIPAPFPTPNNEGITTLIIDAGHGGHDPGTVGKDNYEKDIALAVSLKVQALIDQHLPGVRVVMTRESDVFVPLHERARIAKENNGDLFLSIHCNSFPLKDRAGSETYVMGINDGQENYARIIAENESILFEKNHQEMYGGFDPSSPEGFIYFRLLKNAYRRESSRLALMVEKHYTNNLKRKSWGVKQAPFLVLYQCGMPAILSEIGFLSNEGDEKLLASDFGQQKIAHSIFEAIKSYNDEIKGSR